ncbi:MAG TPA: M14 family metallopeptidase, partial [Candidatus Limnocylindrales bacterium]|nr:M14 family metallopeptidase [Candidatus Limnocylindrales bacterium]
MHPSDRRPAGRLALAAGLLALIGGMLGPAAGHAAGASEFPAGYEAFHTYAEMSAEVAAVEAAHPAIVRRFSIGTSDKGRAIWAAKISDNVGVDEAEPEVLYDGLHHGDEHMSVEMTLRILHWLADGYGTDTRITNIVNSREIWIIFAVNPDGGEFDIVNRRFHQWRKNRQPNAGTSVGTDLNRNYDYRWGGGGATSTNPRAITYRGRAAFSAPETRAVRDFLASRVVDGRQQIRAAISFHEYGRLVMWPYGYTRTNVPIDMTRQDRDALATIGRHMASTNDYRPQQASDLYVSSGTSRDYLYGRYRVFSYTFELSSVDYPKPWR